MNLINIAKGYVKMKASNTMRSAIYTADSRITNMVTQKVIGKFSTYIEIDQAANYSAYWDCVEWVKKHMPELFKEKSTSIYNGNAAFDNFYKVHTYKNKMVMTIIHELYSSCDSDDDSHILRGRFKFYFFSYDEKYIKRGRNLILKSVSRVKDDDNQHRVRSISVVNHIVGTQHQCPGRLKETLFLNKGIWKQIEEYVKFWQTNSNELLEKHGITPKASILLYGKHGTGKSSLIKTIATEFGFDTIHICDINNPFDSDARIVRFGKCNNMNIVVFEEIDIFTSKKIEELTEDEKKVYRDFMQFLDGIDSPGQVLIIGTTNHPENIKPEILRAGRFDLQLEVGDITYDVACKMCESFDVNPDEILKGEKDKLFNPADLQNALIKFKMKKH